MTVKCYRIWTVPLKIEIMQMLIVTKEKVKRSRITAWTVAEFTLPDLSFWAVSTFTLVSFLSSNFTDRHNIGWIYTKRVMSNSLIHSFFLFFFCIPQVFITQASSLTTKQWLRLACHVQTASCMIRALLAYWTFPSPMPASGTLWAARSQISHGFWIQTWPE